MEMLRASFNVINQNPLGSAAGYGSSFPLNRQMTTDLLGFKTLNYNVVYSQMTRGKTEQSLTFALASVASTLSKMAMDMCLYNSQNFGFVSFPDEFTTGSSIMPHKKNPDVWELVRGNSNRIKSLPNEIMLLQSNLPSGYHRDLQLLKEAIVPAIQNIKSSLQLSTLMLENIKINDKVIDDSKYSYIFSVEEVNALVLKGVPFRDAYKQVAATINSGKFVPDTNVKHTHEGSLGNLCNDKISDKFESVLNDFKFESIDNVLKKLVE
jgi:argininosuccinate lyase